MELTHNGVKKFETRSNGITVTGYTYSDGVTIGNGTAYKYLAGASNELQMYHTGGSGNGYLVNNVGTLHLGGGTVGFTNTAVNAFLIRAVSGGTAELYFNGSKKLETTNTGVTVTGNLTVTDDIYLSDANVAYFGTNNDMRIYHSGTHGYIKNTVNNLYFMTTNSKYGALMYANGAVELRYDDVKKFETSSAGASITGDLSITGDIGSTGAEIGDLFIADNKKVFLGSDQDFTLHHNNSHAIIKNTTGRLYVLSDDLWFKNQADNSSLARFLNGDSVILYYAGNPKLQTLSNGITVTGKVIASEEIEASQDYPNIRPTLDLNFAATKKLDPRITYRRTGPASFTDEFGLVKIVSENAPRFDHDPTTRECKGLLIEESRTNLFPYGTTPGDLWSSSKSGTFEENTTETTAPDGTFTATKWTFTNNDPYIYHTQTLSANTSYTISMWVKAGTNMAGDRLQMRIGGAPYSSGDAEVIPADGTWRRVSYTKTVGGSNETSASVGFEPQTSPSGNPASGDVIYIWGAQLEVGGFVTSFIPTYGSTATRGADLAEIDGEDFTDFFNQTEGTINCAYWLGNDNSGMRVFQINDSANSVIDIVAGSGSGAGGYGFVNTGGVAQANGGQSSTNANYLNKLHVTTLAYKANDIAGINRNTGVLTNDTSATLDGAYNRVTFYQHVNSADQLNGHLQRVQYYPKRLPDNQLKNLNNQ